VSYVSTTHHVHVHLVNSNTSVSDVYCTWLLVFSESDGALSFGEIPYLHTAIPWGCCQLETTVHMCVVWIHIQGVTRSL